MKGFVKVEECETAAERNVAIWAVRALSAEVQS
jgi:hypothetical protein